MLSSFGALPDLNFLIAALSSSTVKSDDRLASAVTVLESEATSRDVHRAKSLSASGKRSLLRSCEALAFAVTGHLECVVLLPVSLFMVCHALRLECVYPQTPQPQSTWPCVLHQAYDLKCEG